MILHSKSDLSLSILIANIILCDPLMARPSHSQPFWVNPCKFEPRSERNSAMASFHASTSSSTSRSEEELLENILLTVRIALRHCRDFTERFVRRTFNTELEDHHIRWREHRGLTLTPTKDIPLQPSSALPIIYSLLQSLGPGLEQVVRGQSQHQGEFHQEFHGTNIGLRNVLCELKIAMLELDLEFEDGPDRDIRAEDIEDKSYRDLRDWFVFRDYINSLEYILQLLLRLKLLPQHSASTSAATKNNRYPIVLLIFAFGSKYIFGYT